MSLFKEGALEVDNPQSREEDEELEEQKRRQEELTDLLAAGIHAFNYDESTMNSSATSFEGVEPKANNQQNALKELGFEETERKSVLSNLSDSGQGYKDANYQDQLKVLYDVRVREISKLQKEFEQYKDEKSKEIGVLKNKVFLSEAEIRHLKISLSNSENLLVEKTEIINSLQQNAVLKQQEIDKLKKLIDEMKLEICTYSSTVNELQLKLADNNPFSLEARKFNSEELQKAHQDQVIKLESLLQEQSKKTQILERENKRLDEEIKKLVNSKNEIEEELNLTILGLSKKLQTSQQQAKDFYLLGEAIKKESDHFKERMQQLESNRFSMSSDDFKIKKLDKDTMMVHLEKMKRMLLDKDIEINTLKTKLKCYNSDINELLEYRNLLSNMDTCDFKPCNNSEHEELVIFMQRQLQSYQQAVEDRNNQIMSLNMVNKELQEKIEEMIQQTRSDIRNLSEKYSLPQLETMSNELKIAESTIHELKKQLSEKSETGKLEQANKHNEHLQQMLIEEKQKFEEELARVKGDLKEENAKLKSELKKVCSKLGMSQKELLESDADIHELEVLKSKCGQVHEQLQQVALRLENPANENLDLILQLKKYILEYLDLLKGRDFEKKSEIEAELKRWNDILCEYIEGVKGSSAGMKDCELRDSVEELSNAKTMLEGEKFALEYQLKSRTSELEDARREVKILMENKGILMRELEDNASTIKNLNDQLNELKKFVQLVEDSKNELEKQLEKTLKELNDAKQETIKLHKEANELNENIVRKNLFKELKDVENVLEQSRAENEISGTELFQKTIQAEILKAELLLRERLEEENVQKMQNIEDHYRKALMQKIEMYNKEKEKWKNQENLCRKQFAAIIEKYGMKMEELETENAKLITQIAELANEYKMFRCSAANDFEKYKNMMAESKKNIEVLNMQWEKLLKYYIINFSSIEQQSRKKMKKLEKMITKKQTKVNLVECMYDEKIKKLKNEMKN